MSSTATAGPCAQPVAAPHQYDHIIWIWMENKDAGAILASDEAPFLRSIAASCGTASDYMDHGVHPSLPNYLAATSGGTQHVADDASPSAHPLTVDNIFRQVRAVGKSARSYEAAMQGTCSLTSSGRYAVKHNPAAYFTGGDDRAACQRDDVPFEQFPGDLRDGLAGFSLITPDLCDDMHDCPIATGDRWLRGVVTTITASPAYLDGHTAVFIVFDESEGAGVMPFVAIAPGLVPGIRAAGPLDHFSLLAFTEDALGITDHLGKAAGAPSLAAAFGL